MTLLTQNLETQRIRKTFLKEPTFAKGYIIITDPSANILYASNGIEERKGFSQEEIFEKKPGEVWGGHMDQQFYSQMWRTIKERKEPFAAQINNSKKNGPPLVENIHIAPIINSLGQIKYYLEIQPDITKSSQEALFQKEFLGIFKDVKPISINVIKMLQRWLSPDPTVWQPIASSAVSKGNDLSSLLDKIFLSSRSLAILKDKKLITAAKINHEEFGQIYRKYRDIIFQYLYYRVNHNMETAEDLTQETFARSFRSLTYYTFQNYTYLNYLLIVARHLLINYYRSRKSLSLEAITKNQALQTYGEFIQKVETDIVWEIVKSLSPFEQKILQMKYIADQSIKNIAKKFGKSENAITLLLSRARKKIRKNLLRY